MKLTLFCLISLSIVAIDVFALLFTPRVATRRARLGFWAALVSLCMMPVCVLSLLKLLASFFYGDTAAGIAFVVSGSVVVIGTLVALGTVIAASWQGRHASA